MFKMSVCKRLTTAVCAPWSSFVLFDTNTVVHSVAMCQPLCPHPCLCELWPLLLQIQQSWTWNCTLNSVCAHWKLLYLWLFLCFPSVLCDLSAKLQRWTFSWVWRISAEFCRLLGQCLDQWMADGSFLLVTMRLFSSLFLLDLHELTSLILNNKKAKTSSPCWIWVCFRGVNYL